MNYDYYHRANLAISDGALTNSKRLSSFIKGISPSHAKSGYGPYIIDHENKKYLDFICGLGCQIFGYSHPLIIKPITEDLNKGITLSLSSTIEVEAAEKMKEIFPFIDKGRFLKTGTEACLAAVRIARAHHHINKLETTRALVLCDGYHGHGDIFQSLVNPAFGVIQDISILPLKGNDHLIEKACAVIVEPIITDASEERTIYLKELRKKCQIHGTLLIFDEIITGFRYPSFSFSTYSGIFPDILCLGKAIGGGFPLSYIGLRKDIAKDIDWFVSSTFAGETISLRAFLETYKQLKNNSEFRIQDLWDKGINFIETFNLFFPEKIKIEGYGTRGIFKGDELTFALFMQECHKAGILIGPSIFFNFSNIAYKEVVLSSFQDILIRIKNNEIKLEGEMPKKPYAMRIRE